MKLEDEKGDVWTFGLRKDISDKTSLAVHYDWTNMSNAVTSYSVMTKIVNNVPQYENRAVNAKETKKSFNITADHKFDEHWNLGLSYTHMR